MKNQEKDATKTLNDHNKSYKLIYVNKEARKGSFKCHSVLLHISFCTEA